MVMMLRQCCCGCTLKTGTIILGVLNIIAAIANFISGIVVASAMDTFDCTGTDSIQDCNDIMDTVKALMITTAVIAAILFIVACCLIAGAVYENPVLLVPWMVYIILYAIANCILYIINGATYISAGLGATAAGSFISAILILLLEGYFLLVVYSLYRDLKGTAPSPA